MDFNNTKIAFQDKSNQDLRRANLLFRTMAKPWMVKTGKVLLQFALSTRLPIGWIIKPTIYRHFVGGETLEKCQPVVDLDRKSVV